MRIAFVVFTDFPERTAPARRVHMIAKGLAVQGHDVYVFIPQRFTPGPLEQGYDGLRVRWSAVASPTALAQLSQRFTARLALIRDIHRLALQGLDWLVTYNLGLDSVPMVATLRQHGGSIAAMYDDLRAVPHRKTVEDVFRMFWLNTADHWLPKHTQLNIVISTFLEDRFRRIAPGTPLIVVPPLVDPNRFLPKNVEATAFRESWGIGDSVLVSYLGSYWRVDGVTILLQAVKSLVQQGLKFRVAISGAVVQGMECDDVSTLIRSLSLEEIVVQTGWLATDDVVSAMTAADVLVVPKLNDVANIAGTPTKLAEYLSVGRAVVASNIGDIPRYILDRQNGLLCKPGDVNSLAQALSDLITHPDLRHRLAANARATAQEHFDYRAAGKRVEAAMQQARS